MKKEKKKERCEKKSPMSVSLEQLPIRSPIADRGEFILFLCIFLKSSGRKLNYFAFS